MADDVRVRLSAEGEAQIAAAFRKVVANAQKSGKAAAQGFQPFNNALSGARGLLAGLAGVASVGAFIAISKRAADAADQVARLSKALGFTTRDLSSLANAARTNEVPIEGLQKGIQNLTKQIAALREGNADAKQTFSDLGLSAASFKGKDAAERLEIVAKAFGKLADGPDKANLAIELFSKQGVALLPVLDEIANVGLAGIRVEAERVGAAFDEDIAAAADAAGDTFQNLDASVQGLALRFVAGLTPAIETTVGALTEGLAEGQDSMLEFGKIFGRIVVFIVNIVDTLGTKIAQLAYLIVGLVKATGQALGRDFAGAAVTLSETFDALGANEQDLENRLKGRLDKLEEREKAKRVVKGAPGADAPERIDRKASDETARKEKERAAAIKRLQDERARFEADVLEAEGRRHEIAIANIDREAARLAEVLQELEKLGLDQGDIDAKVAAFRAALSAQEAFRTASDEAGKAFNDLQDEGAKIQDQVAAGLLSEFEGQEKILALEKERLPILREIAQALILSAEAAKDPEALLAAQAFAANVESLAVHVAGADNLLGRLKSTAIDAFQGGLKDLFTEGARSAEGFIGVLLQLGNAVVSAIQQVLAAELAAAATRAILKALGLSTGGQVGEVQGKAEGGLISGAGTSTSDSIPAMLSTGEFVVRASAVQIPGVLEMLSAINSGSRAPVLSGPERRPRFAEGGLVSGAGASGGQTSLTVALGEGLVASQIETPAGERAIVRVLQKNKNAAGRALGRG